MSLFSSLVYQDYKDPDFKEVSSDYLITDSETLTLNKEKNGVTFAY